MVFAVTSLAIKLYLNLSESIVNYTLSERFLQNIRRTFQPCFFFLLFNLSSIPISLQLHFLPIMQSQDIPLQFHIRPQRWRQHHVAISAKRFANAANAHTEGIRSVSFAFGDRSGLTNAFEAFHRNAEVYARREIGERQTGTRAALQNRQSPCPPITKASIKARRLSWASCADARYQ